ncbi:ROK family transcriptional regulator [Beijerinckia indica]|uniref:ROK family protein n=1 Tax=Beijerinckia indica subsp. indica (strain ATCC 9039 / DSM 1715 / NCIMB 8712) TaxID=395963 RepID=B2IDS2_BEII9|nr:ROK family transcriptional regulator [Beijerinckia indica]ACB96854.1 ROK family protein [Beijerinckia indica subsp. indica ATCC 9039]
MQTGDTELIRAINRFHVLDTIRRFEPVSRAAIGKRTHLSRVTVSSLIATLLQEGLIHEESDETTNSGTRGRPTNLLGLNPNAAYVVGAKLSMHQVFLIVTNLRADPLARLSLPLHPHQLVPDAIVALLDEGVRSVVALAGLKLGQIAGLGIGLPGFIDSKAGISHWSPILAPEPKPVALADMVRRRLGLAVTIENDANLLTLAERWFGECQENDNFVVVMMEAGIGMGLFLDGELYRGQHGMGTEFGHSKIDRHGPRCRCGQYGCIEAFTADYAILREAEKIIRTPAAHEGADDTAEAETRVATVVRLAREGNVALRQIFATAGEILGLGIANLINIIDPAKIVISGSGTRAVDLIEPALRAAVAANTLAVLQNRCEIIFHDQGDEVWARGAASLVLQALYRKPWTPASGAEIAIMPGTTARHQKGRP